MTTAALRPTRALDARQLVFLAIGVIAVIIAATEGLSALGQSTINGLVSGSYAALGAVGLTLVFGILRLINFAHGEYLTAGAYFALTATTSGVPLILAFLLAGIGVGILAVLAEKVLWGPLRRMRAGTWQMLLVAIGLSLALRSIIQLIWGTNQRSLPVDRVSTVNIGPLYIGKTALLVLVIAALTLVGLAFFLQRTNLGRQMRAYADNAMLAESSGVSTQRIILVTWILAGVLAGLGGAFAGAALGVVTPLLGVNLLLSIFAAVVLGGIGNAFGALTAAMVLGVMQEWSVFWIGSQWKLSISFILLIICLLYRPNGIFGTATGVDR